MCDIYSKSEANQQAWKFSEDGIFAWESEVLPECVVDWANLPSDNPSLDVTNDMWEKYGQLKKYVHISLAQFNDGGFNFAQIADLIEKEL